MEERLKYSEETFLKIQVCGVKCELSDMSISKDNIPEEKCLYDVAGDDNCGDEPVRVIQSVLVNFFGTLISDRPLPVGVTVFYD